MKPPMEVDMRPMEVDMRRKEEEEDVDSFNAYYFLVFQNTL